MPQHIDPNFTDKTTIEVSDELDFYDEVSQGIIHRQHDVIDFDADGNPRVICGDETLTVKPEQIIEVFKQEQS